jgi:hypothetical protein
MFFRGPLFFPPTVVASGTLTEKKDSNPHCRAQVSAYQMLCTLKTETKYNAYNLPLLFLCNQVP